MSEDVVSYSVTCAKYIYKPKHELQGVSATTCRYDWTLLSLKNSRRQDISENRVELQ